MSLLEPWVWTVGERLTDVHVGRLQRLQKLSSILAKTVKHKILENPDDPALGPLVDAWVLCREELAQVRRRVKEYVKQELESRDTKRLTGNPASAHHDIHYAHNNTGTIASLVEGVHQVTRESITKVPANFHNQLYRVPFSSTTSLHQRKTTTLGTKATSYHGPLNLLPKRRFSDFDQPDMDIPAAKFGIHGAETASGGVLMRTQSDISGDVNIDVASSDNLYLFLEQQGFDEPFVSMEVAEPQTARTGNVLAVYTVYNVVGLKKSGEMIEAMRRYTDFQTLRKVLCRQYPALRELLPQLPEKKVIGKFKSAFLERRRAGLEQLLKSVVDHQRSYRFLARYLHRFMSDQG
eukprot:m.151718 g.151718  ORF g.151718 m.151718 type:complete len:350 (+) comp15043_c0_seq5:264-1313(+)